MTDPAWGSQFDPARMTWLAWTMAGLFIMAVVLGFLL